MTGDGTGQPTAARRRGRRLSLAVAALLVILGSAAVLFGLVHQQQSPPRPSIGAVGTIGTHPEEPTASATASVPGDSAGWSSSSDAAPTRSANSVDAPTASSGGSVGTGATEPKSVPSASAQPSRPPASTQPSRPPASSSSASEPPSDAATAPTSPAGPVAAPTTIAIPTLDVASELITVGLAPDGTLEVPSGPDYHRAGWFSGSPAPGAIGPAVIEGHVDSAAEGPSVFYRLGAIEPGDRITVGRADGSTIEFEVYAARAYPKDDFPTLDVYGNTAGPELRLITCGGDLDPSTGHYRDNTVVFARVAG